MEALYLIAFAFLPFALIISFAAIGNRIVQKKSRIPFDYANTARIPAFSLLQ